jgi:hypothetical protein
MSKKEVWDLSTDRMTEEGIAVQMIDSIIGMAGILKNNYAELMKAAAVKEALIDLAHDEDLAWVLAESVKADMDLENHESEEDKEEEEELENDAASGTTQPTYIDESGKVFTASDIVSGYKPKGSYKGHSISDRINSEDFGKVK